jgi:hypothetical protein
MSFKIGGGSSKSSGTMSSTTDQASNFNKTSTPNVPDWLLQPTQANQTRLNGLANIDPRSLVPGADPLQTQAAGSAAHLGSPWNFDAAISNTRDLAGTQTPSAVSASLLDNLPAYMSPYTSDVVRTTLAGFDKNAAATRAAQTLALAGSGAFGGSGAAITQSQTEGSLAQARAAQEAQLRDQAFQTGAGLSNLDAGRRQQTSQFNSDLSIRDQQEKAALAAQLAGLAQAKDTNAQGNIQTQEGVGAVNRGIATDQARAPFDFQAWLEQMQQGQDPSLFTGQTQAGTEATNTKQTGTQTGKGSQFGWSIGANVTPTSTGFSVGPGARA